MRPRCGRRDLSALETRVEREPAWCRDCGEQLGDDEVDHGEQGFGHQGRCCGCYEDRQRGPGGGTRG